MGELQPNEQEAANKIVDALDSIKNPALREILLDPTLSNHQRKLKCLPFLSQLRREIADTKKRRDALVERQSWAEDMIRAGEEYEAWKELAPKLEVNDCSRLHQLVGFLKIQYDFAPELNEGMSPYEFPWKEVHSFVVQHDWAAAFKNAGDYAGNGFRLPYEWCSFELRISNRSIAVLCHEADEQPITYIYYSNFGDAWVSQKEHWEKPVFLFAKEQVKAICVALDAEVATHNVTRVSEKINRKRVEEGREPFFDYHVVSLNRRLRVANPAKAASETQGRKRLHFRRGHWRHFANFKSWVRWCLVGNPELGFIDKEYRL